MFSYTFFIIIRNNVGWNERIKNHVYQRSNLAHPAQREHSLGRFHDPSENIDMMRYYLRQRCILHKNNIIYSVFEKD
jgi:hypothetical protein